MIFEGNGREKEIEKFIRNRELAGEIISVEDVMREFDVSKNYARKRLENVYVCVKPEKKARHYYFNKDSKRYIVNKSINNVPRFFCSFENEEDAKRAVELFEACDWDYDARYVVRNAVLGRE